MYKLKIFSICKEWNCVVLKVLIWVATKTGRESSGCSGCTFVRGQREMENIGEILRTNLKHTNHIVMIYCGYTLLYI